MLFCIDNIDFTEDTPFGQNTTHGTAIVLIQEDDETGEKINPPLTLLKKPAENDANVEYLDLEDIVPKAIKFSVVDVNNQVSLNSLLREYFKRDQTWALACHLTNKTGEVTVENTDAEPIEVEVEDDEQGIEKIKDHQQEESISDTIPSKKIDEKLMPTWASTNSLLLKDRKHVVRKMNSGVMPPLLLRSPTNMATLYTAVKFTENVSCFITESNKKQ